MRKLYFLTIILLLSAAALVSGQKFTVTGTVIDTNGGEPLEFVQIGLLERDSDLPVTGGMSGSDGKFELRAEAGKYDLLLSYIGYEKRRLRGVELTEDIALGTLYLETASTALEEVTVTGEEPFNPISSDIDGLTIRPEKNLSTLGGNLLDVLRDIPSVNVSQDGTVSIRGSSGTNILINGRSSALAADLEQIPASVVRQIKIITNPNARYDAQGTGGVINIKLKQTEATQGMGGRVEATYGTGGKWSSSVRLSHSDADFNVYGGYSYRKWPRTGNSSTTRLTFEDMRRLEQDEDDRRSDEEHTFNLGGDYFFGKNKISYEGAINFENEVDREFARTQLFDINSGGLLLQYARRNVETEENYSLDNALIYERLFDDEDREFRLSVSHSFRDQLEEQAIGIFANEIDPGDSEPGARERSITDDYSERFEAQADYIHPLDEVSYFESGLKSSVRKYDDDFVFERFNEASEEWREVSDQSNRFLYEYQVHAAYFIYTREMGPLTLSGGLRAEQTQVDTRLFDTGTKTEQNYLDLFPSAQMLYKLNENHSLKATYSRRIDRPGGWRLNPFPDVSDSLNIRMGNPGLQPEYIQSYEAGHMFNKGSLNFTTNIFYRKVNGLVDYVVNIEDGVSIRMPVNLNSSETYGVEIINSTQAAPWWSFDASFSLFETVVDATNLGDFNNDGIGWNAKLTSEFKLPWELDLQLTGNYTAPDIEAQGRDEARYYIDLGMQRKFLDDKLTASLSFRDIFDTRRFEGENFSDEFRQTFVYERESRILLLSLSYSLN